MSKKISILLVIIAVGLSVLSMAVTMAPEGNYHKSGRIVKLQLDNIGEMAIYRGPDLVAGFYKKADNSGWRVSIPDLGVKKGRADKVIVEGLLNFAASLQPIEAQGVTVEKSGVNAEDSVQFVMTCGNESDSVYIGNFSDDAMKRYFVSDSAPEKVLEVDAVLARVFDRKVEDYRSLNIFEASSKSPDKIIIFTGQGSDIELSRAGGGWVVDTPVVWPADQERVGRALRFCAMLRGLEIADIAKPKEIEKAARIEITRGDKTEKVYFWSNGEDSYAYRDGDIECYKIPNGASAFFANVTADAFQEKSLDLLGGKEIAAFEIKKKEGGACRLQKSGNKWNATGRDNFLAETEAVKQLSRMLTMFPISRVVTTKQDFADPVVELVAFDMSGRQIAGVSAVKLSSGEYLGKISGRRELVILPAIAVQALSQDYSVYRNRYVQRLDFRDIESVEFIAKDHDYKYIRKSEGNYTMQRPEVKGMSESGNWDLLSAIRKISWLKCEGYVPEKNMNLSDFGLDQPTLKTILTIRSDAGDKDQSGKKIELIIGKSFEVPGADGTKSIMHFAKLSDFKLVFLLDEKIVKKLFIEYK